GTEREDAHYHGATDPRFNGGDGGAWLCQLHQRISSDSGSSQRSVSLRFGDPRSCPDSRILPLDAWKSRDDSACGTKERAEDWTTTDPHRLSRPTARLRCISFSSPGKCHQAYGRPRPFRSLPGGK